MAGMRVCPVCGVYCITNTMDGNKYIGSSVDIRNRWNKHKRLLSNNNHHSKHLQNAWNKYGEACFEFSIIENCEKDNLIEKEQAYIDNLMPIYNVCTKAGNTLGFKHTDENKQKFSGELHYLFGKHMSEETKNKQREVKLGKKASDETKLKISEVRTGRKHSEETKRRIAEAQKRRYAEAC